jgi:hypothetical protein
MRAPFAGVVVAVNRRRLDVSAKPLERSRESLAAAGMSE